MFNNIKSIKITDKDNIILKDYDTIFINSIHNNICGYYTLNKESRDTFYYRLNMKYSVSKSLFNSDYNLWRELYDSHNKDFNDYHFILDINNNLILNISDKNSVNCDINYNILNMGNNVNSNIITEKVNGYSNRAIANMDNDKNIYYVFEFDYINSKYFIYSYQYVNNIFVPLFSNKPAYESNNFYDMLNFDLNDDILLSKSIPIDYKIPNICDYIKISVNDMLCIIKNSKLTVKMDKDDRFLGFVGVNDSNVFKMYFDNITESYRTLKKMGDFQQSSIEYDVSVKYILETLTNYYINCDFDIKMSALCKVYSIIESKGTDYD